MPWSTRELAELAGTTVNTIRHYHRLGLIEEPERRYNGYKQYGVRDLVRLLRIRRLAGMGVPLSRIGEVDAGTETARGMLQELDAELAASIERLNRARADIAAILKAGAPADVPAGFASVASQLSEPDMAMLHISGQLYDEQVMADLRSMAEADADAGEIGKVIEALAEDADEATRQDLVEELAAILSQNLIDYSWLMNPAGRLSKDEGVAQRTVIEAMVELYTPAQLDVLSRASILAHRIAHADGAASDEGEELAGAVLAELALDERVNTTTNAIGIVDVAAVEGQAPSDEMLRTAWDYVAGKSRAVQTILPAIGPALRETVLERLVGRGDIREEKRKMLGLFTTSALVDGGTGRRAKLLGELRDALTGMAEPTPRVGALAGLIWGSGTLAQLDPEIPWTSPVIARAEALARGNWGAAASAEAVLRTMTAVVAGPSLR